MRVLVTGSNGQLGNELRRILTTRNAEIGAISSLYQGAQVDYIDFDTLDISDASAVRSWFVEHAPYDLTINCAAMTNVDGCEQAEAKALQVNAIGPENLAREVSAKGGKFVHVSTDYVFSGNEETPRVETDRACPVSAYGRTKWAGELLAQTACSRTFIVRTAWLYGYVGKNFVKTMMRLAKKNGKISVVSDQFGNPTSANDLAYEILALGVTEQYGIYHCTNEGACSWFDFASRVVDLAGIPCEKEALSTAQYRERFPLSADRPRYSSLENRHLKETIGNAMRPWEDALAMYIARLGQFGD